MHSEKQKQSPESKVSGKNKTMKKQFTVAAFLIFNFFFLISFAQYKQYDTLKIKWKESKIWIFEDKDIVKIDNAKKEKKNKKNFTHWGGIDMGINMLTTAESKLKLPEEQDPTQMNNFLELNYSKSLFFSLNLLKKNIRLYKNYVNVVTGLGFEWNSYNFKNNITLAPNAPYISASTLIVIPDSIKFSKNKLKVAYIKAPLLLELNTNSENPDKSFHIAGGIEFAYKIGSKTKQVYEINGYEVRSKFKDDYHLADIKYSSVVRVGYGDYFTLFANYGLSQLFEKNKGTEVFPLTTGISITF